METTEIISGGSVFTTYEGPRAEVDLAVQKYLDQYWPGYMGRVESVTHTGGDIVRVVMTRWTTCD